MIAMMHQTARFFLLVVPFAVVAFAAAHSVQAQGVLTFETESYDFGSIAEGEKPTYTFRFTNTGDEAITVTDVRPSCGCTVPSYSTETVAPGEMGEIMVEYDSEGRPGDFNKTIAVQADGAADGSTTLRITGTVIPANIRNGVVQGGVVFDADLHTFNDLHEGERAAHTFRMQNTGELPLTISEARVFNDAVLVKYPARLIFPGEIVTIEVFVERPEAALNHRGELDVAIVLSTDDADQPVKSLRLRGRLNSEDQASGTQSTETQ